MSPLRPRTPLLVAVLLALTAAMVSPAEAGGAAQSTGVRALVDGPVDGPDERRREERPPGTDRDRFTRDPSAPATLAPTSATQVDPLPDLRAEAAAEGSVRVIVQVEDGDPATAVAAELSGTEHEVMTAVDDVVAVEVGPEALERLEGAAGVGDIVADLPLTLHLAESNTRIGADVAFAEGWDGTGRRIAVIDTGIDGGHDTWGDGGGGQILTDEDHEACFISVATGDPCYPLDDGDGDPTRQFGPGASVPCAATDCWHGTHVTSIAVGRGGGGASRGVAPAAALVPIRIFYAVDAGRSTANSSDLLAALEYVRGLDASGTRIDAVNLSLGFNDENGFPYGAQCDGVMPSMTAKFAQLRQQDVAVVVSTGNNYRADGVSFPACISHATAVTSTRETVDEVSNFSNTNHLVALAAPGSGVTAAVPGGVGTASGTSMAAPQVAAAAALLREKDPGISVEAMEERLWQTGAVVTDSASGLQLRRIDVAAALGERAPQPAPPTSVAWAVTNQGRVFRSPGAGFWGDSPPRAWGESVVAGTPTRSGMGYWLVTSLGRVFAYGDAEFAGDMSTHPLNQPITAMTTTASGKGYWLLGADGGVFSFGDAVFYGSTGGMPLNAPVTDIARTPTGGGYWLTAKDGGVFSFGDATFHGSTGSLTLNRPVVSIAAGPSGGYWLAALDGGVFAFSVPFHGSLYEAGVGNETGYRVRSTASGRGYYITTLEGGVYPFAMANDLGRVGGLQLWESTVDLMVPGT